MNRVLTILILVLLEPNFSFGMSPTGAGVTTAPSGTSENSATQSLGKDIGKHEDTTKKDNEKADETDDKAEKLKAAIEKVNNNKMQETAEALKGRDSQLKQGADGSPHTLSKPEAALTPAERQMLNNANDTTNPDIKQSITDQLYDSGTYEKRAEAGLNPAEKQIYENFKNAKANGDYNSAKALQEQFPADFRPNERLSPQTIQDLNNYDSKIKSGDLNGASQIRNSLADQGISPKSDLRPPGSNIENKNYSFDHGTGVDKFIDKTSKAEFVTDNMNYNTLSNSDRWNNVSLKMSDGQFAQHSLNSQGQHTFTSPDGTQSWLYSQGKLSQLPSTSVLPNLADKRLTTPIPSSRLQPMSLIPRTGPRTPVFPNLSNQNRGFVDDGSSQIVKLK